MNETRSELSAARMLESLRGVWKRRVRLAAVGVAGTLALSCSQATEGTAPDRSEQIGTVGSALSGPQQLTVSLPNGVGLHAFGLVASDQLQIDPAASVTSGVAGTTAIANVGTHQTSVGIGATVGDVYSQSSVQLLSGATVNGNITTHGTVTSLPPTTVTGTVKQNATLTPLAPFSWNTTFQSSNKIVLVINTQTQVLAPGAYGDVHVFGGGTLKLSTGTYYLNSLELDGLTNVVVDATSGPVFVYVASQLTYLGTLTAGGNENRVLFGYLGVLPLVVAAPLTANIVAPNALLQLAPLLGNHTVRGSFFAKQIEVGAGTTVQLAPFAGWDFLFPPVPFVDCVTRFDDTHENALFGYTNPLDVPVSIPVGSRNVLTPGSSPAPQATTFAPGKQDKVFLAGFPGGSLTWNVGGNIATADGTTRKCAPADYEHPGDATAPVSEGASPPGPSSIARALSNQEGPGLRFESGSLPFDFPTHGFTSTTTPNFELVIDGQHLGSDAICGPDRLRAFVTMAGQNLGSQDLPGCTNGIACGVPIPNQVFDAPVPSTQAAVHADIDMYEVDTTLCGGGDDHEFTLHLDIDNTTGLTTGSVDTYADTSSGTPSSTDALFTSPVDCSQDDQCCFTGGADGYGICWRVSTTAKPRICTAWNAQYIDAGLGEDFASSQNVQQIPASFALATLTLTRDGATNSVSTPLDEDGCIPPDLSPELDALTLPSGTDPFTLKLQYSTQFCLDPAGQGCKGSTGQKTGARFSVQRNGMSGPSTACTEFSTDSTLSDPDCEIVKASDAGAWSGARPVPNIRIVNKTQNDLSRISGVVSTLLKRDVDTHGNLSIQAALIDNAAANPTGVPDPGEIDILTNSICPPPTNDTCADDPVRYRGQDSCFGSQPNANCRAADDRWKFVVAHEIGHVIQRRVAGLWLSSYTFNDGSGNAVTENDPPGAPPLCRCDHVDIANRLHCLQSIEMPSASQVEGFAQYFASKTWNDTDQNDCTFNYYKEFLDKSCHANVADCAPQAGNTGLFVNTPPVPVDCVTPKRWRNDQCLSQPISAGEAVASMGVEYDWMGFYYNLTKTSAPVLGSTAMLELYRTACNQSGGFCEEGNMAWEDCPSCTPAEIGIHPRIQTEQQAGTVTMGQLAGFETLGDMFGVSHSTAR